MVVWIYWSDKREVSQVGYRGRQLSLDLRVNESCSEFIRQCFKFFDIALKSIINIMSYNQNKGEDYTKNSAQRAGEKLKQARQDVFGKTQNQKTVGDKMNEKLEQDKPVMDKVWDYTKNTAEKTGQNIKEAKQETFGKSENDKTFGDKMNDKIQKDKPVMEKASDYTKNTAQKANQNIKGTKEEVFGKVEKDKTFGDKVNEKMERDKPLAERVGDYAKNTAETAGNSLKNAKQEVVGKSEDDKTLGDKAKEKADNPEQKPMMEKVGTYISNTMESAAESLQNTKQQIMGKSEDQKTLGDKANEKTERERHILGEKVEKTGKDIQGEETVGEKLSNMGKNIYDGAADMADSAAKKLGLKENQPTLNK